MTFLSWEGLRPIPRGGGGRPSSTVSWGAVEDGDDDDVVMTRNRVRRPLTVGIRGILRRLPLLRRTLADGGGTCRAVEEHAASKHHGRRRKVDDHFGHTGSSHEDDVRRDRSGRLDDYV